MQIINDDDRNGKEKILTIANGRLLYFSESSSSLPLNFLKALKALNPNGDIHYHSPHHKNLKEQRHLFETEGITLVTTPPAWCRSRSAVEAAMLTTLFIEAPKYSELILVEGSADFTMAVCWLSNVHRVSTTVAVPASVRVAKSLLAVAHAYTTLT